MKEARSRAVLKEATQEEAASVLKDAEAAAQEATADMTRASEARHGEILLKAQTAYRSLLSSQWTGTVDSLKKVPMEEEEKMVGISERKAQAMVIFTSNGYLYRSFTRHACASLQLLCAETRVERFSC